MLPVGSSDGSVVLLVNHTVLCKLSLDQEFNRLLMGTCMIVEPSLQVGTHHTMYAIHMLLVSFSVALSNVDVYNVVKPL